MSNKIKLSPKQKEVVGFMRDGWQLGGKSLLLNLCTSMLQDGGIGRGGKCISVPYQTLRSLALKGVILAAEKTGIYMTYKLTKLGKTIDIT